MFALYLANRKQYTIIDHCFSNLEMFFFGVPQGSFLGPLLFSVLVNDLCFLFNSTPQLNADDTAILLQHKNIIDLEKNANSMLESILNWMNANLLIQSLYHTTRKTIFSINVTYRKCFEL